MSMDTLLFSVGIFIFMISVYGVVMAGGFKLWRMRREGLGDDTDFIVNADGWEVIKVRAKSAPDVETQVPRQNPPPGD